MTLPPRHVGAALSVALVSLWSGATLAQGSADPALAALAAAIREATGTSTPLISVILVVGAWMIVREGRAALTDATRFLRDWRPTITVRHVQADDTAAVRIPTDVDSAP